jgi:hypothetical protein
MGSSAFFLREDGFEAGFLDFEGGFDDGCPTSISTKKHEETKKTYLALSLRDLFFLLVATNSVDRCRKVLTRLVVVVLLLLWRTFLRCSLLLRGCLLGRTALGFWLLILFIVILVFVLLKETGVGTA